MSRFLLTLSGGPCAGAYETAYARAQLRAVRTADGRLDVLDASGDEPERGEDVFAYVVDERRGPGHLCMRGPTRCLLLISYRYVGPVDAETGEIVGPLDQAMSERLADVSSREVAMSGWADPAVSPADPRDRSARAAGAVLMSGGSNSVSHDHREYVEGCFRCDLGCEELQQPGAEKEQRT